MAYEHGLIHGDTHPGNILLMPSGHIALIDFGLHGQVPKDLHDKMLELVFAQVSGDTDAAVEGFVKVFHPDPSTDVEAFKRELEEVISLPDQATGIGDDRITEGVVRGMRIGSKYRMEAQSDLFMVLRCGRRCGRWFPS